MTIAGFAAWLALSRWVVPRLIGAAYREESLGILNRILSGRDQHALSIYLDAWSSLSWKITIALVVGAVVIFVWMRARHLTARLVERAVRRDPEVSGRFFLLLAVWFGALAGVAEIAHLTIRHLIERHPARGFTLELVWMGPPSAALVFGVLGLVLVTLVRILDTPRRGLPSMPLKPAVFLFAGLACYSVLESDRFRLVTVAVLVLSAGLAAAIARAASNRAPGFRRGVRRSSAPIGAVLAASTIAGLVTLPAPLERRRLADLPPPDADGPNVLLIILDTVRASSLSLYGYELSTTPSLDRWAESAVVFEQAIATSPWTLPSHASVFTGRWHFEVSADIGVPLDDEHATLAEALAGYGYATAGFAANRAYTTVASGLARGFARYEDYPVTFGRFLVSSWLSRTVSNALLPMRGRPWRTGRKNATAVTDEFLDWLSDLEGRPFFTFLNYIDAHDPYIAPPRFRRMFPSDQPIIIEKREGVTEEELKGTLAAYDAAIAFVDDEVGRLLSDLDRRGLLDNTLLIVASDHGEHFGEHGLQLHTNSLYMPLLRVPLLIRYPGRVPGGVRVSEFVSIRDIPATVMQVVTGGARQPFPGESLTRFWDEGDGGGSSSASVILAEMNQTDILKPWESPYWGPVKSIVIDGHHYIRHHDGREELYDLASDPAEERDLAGTSASATLLSRARASLDSLVGRANPHRSGH